MWFAVRRIGALFCIFLVLKSRTGHLVQVRISILLTSLATFLCTHPDTSSSFLNMAVQNCR